MQVKTTGIEETRQRYNPSRLLAAMQKGLRDLEKDATARVRMRMTGGAARRRGNVSARIEGGNLILESHDPVVRFLERGTRPHVIAARRVKFLRFEVGGTILFRKKVNHPGTKGQGFFRRTLTEDGNRFALVLQRAIAEHFRESLVGGR